MKACYRCNIEKPLGDFHRHRGRRDGHNDVCKACATKRQSIYSRTDGAMAARAKFFAEYKERPKVRERIQKYFRNYQRNRNPDALVRDADVRKRRRKRTPRSSLYSIVYAAFRRRPSENMVTVDDLMEMFEVQRGRCAVSGIGMTWANGTGRRSPTSMSLDRIDGNLGYEKSNVRLVCWQVNLFKNEWSDDQMLTMAKAIVARAEQSGPSWKSFPAFTDESDFMVMQ